MSGIGPGPLGPLGPPGPGRAAVHGMQNMDDDIIVSSANATTTTPATKNPKSSDTTAFHSATSTATAISTNGKAPDVVGIGKIEPGQKAPQNNNNNGSTTMRRRIIVPQRSINGGFDFKFDDDPYRVKLQGIMTPIEYEQCIQTLNNTIKPSRSNGLDKALLVTGPLLVPLALWGIRHGRQAKRRKKLLKKAIQEFNHEHPALYMRYNHDRPSDEGYLSIEAINAPVRQSQQATRRTGLESSALVV